MARGSVPIHIQASERAFRFAEQPVRKRTISHGFRQQLHHATRNARIVSASSTLDAAPFSVPRFVSFFTRGSRRNIRSRIYHRAPSRAYTLRLPSIVANY
jgi:hypothetical protein